MESILPLICLLLGSAIPVAGAFFLIRRGVRQLAVAAAYREVSRDFGLSVDTRGLSLHGHLDDRRIWIGEVMVGHGRDRRTAGWGVLDLERPLGLGFLLRRRGLSHRVFRRSRAPETTLGDPHLDRTLEVRGDNPATIRALLTTDVQGVLKAVIKRWPDIVITDDSVRVHLRQPEASTTRLRALVESMQRLAQVIETARVEIEPPSHVRSHLAAWKEMAQRHGLTFEPWLPAMSGDLDGRRIQITLRRDLDGYNAALRLYFVNASPEIGLGLRPQEGPDGYGNVGQDIQVGDPAFDKAFVIKGYDPIAVRAILSEEARAELLQLRDAGPLEVDDRCLHLRGLPLDPVALEPLVKQAVVAAEAMGM